MTAVAEHQQPAANLTDVALVDAFVEMHRLHTDLGKAHLNIEIFNTITAYNGIVNAEKIDHDFFSGERARRGELRTISGITLSFGKSTDDTIHVKFERNSGTRIHFSPIGITTAQQAAQEAEQSLQHIIHQRNAQQQQQTLKQALQEANQNLAAATARQTPQIVRLVTTAHECGLIATPVHDDSSTKDGATAVRALAERIAELQTTIRTQTRNNEEGRKHLLQEYDSRTEQLRREYQERFDRMKADHEAWEAEAKRRAEERDQELEQLAKALDEREVKLDLQTERDARRKLREKIQTAATKMFEQPDLSDQAKASFERVAKACRWTIVGAVVLLAVALFVPPVLELGLKKVLSTEVIWLVWSMRILGGITLAAALIYYVSSLSAWSRQVSSIELRSKQFALDIDRASWLVEMALEYEKEGKALPAAMVESFTRGLFDGGAQGAQHEPPSASLLHLLHNAESLKLGAGGAELTFTGKQLRKADAQASKGA